LTFGGLSIVFDRGFLGMKIFGNNIDLLLGFGWKRGEEWRFIDGDRGRLGSILLGITVGWRSSWGKFLRNFGPKSIRFLISI